MAKTAVITGASSGLGAEYARLLAARGADLVLVARDREALDGLARELVARHHVGVEVMALDLLKPRQRAKLERRLADHEHPVEMLVNNAGFGLPLAFERNAVEDEVRHLDLHVEVPLRLSHAALGPMLERGHGRILNVASVAGFTPRSTYGACKGWLISFSRWANVEYEKRGVGDGGVPGVHSHELPRARRAPTGAGRRARLDVARRDDGRERIAPRRRARACGVDPVHQVQDAGRTHALRPLGARRARGCDRTLTSSAPRGLRHPDNLGA